MPFDVYSYVTSNDGSKNRFWTEQRDTDRPHTIEHQDYNLKNTIETRLINMVQARREKAILILNSDSQTMQMKKIIMGINDYKHSMLHWRNVDSESHQKLINKQNDKLAAAIYKLRELNQNAGW